MKVYFNNSCKICKTEIDLYKKEKIQGIDWIDITKYRFLYKFFSLPIIFNIFSYGYEFIAFFLYLKNKKLIKKKY